MYLTGASLCGKNHEVDRVAREECIPNTLPLFLEIAEPRTTAPREIQIDVRLGVSAHHHRNFASRRIHERVRNRPESKPADETSYVVMLQDW